MRLFAIFGTNFDVGRDFINPTSAPYPRRPKPGSLPYAPSASRASRPPVGRARGPGYARTQHGTLQLSSEENKKVMRERRRRRLGLLPWDPSQSLKVYDPADDLLIFRYLWRAYPSVAPVLRYEDAVQTGLRQVRRFAVPLGMLGCAHGMQPILEALEGGQGKGVASRDKTLYVVVGDLIPYIISSGVDLSHACPHRRILEQILDGKVDYPPATAEAHRYCVMRHIWNIDHDHDSPLPECLDWPGREHYHQCQLISYFMLFRRFVRMRGVFPHSSQVYLEVLWKLKALGTQVVFIYPDPLFDRLC
ncbi:Uu.00g144170.m01.CDS01 [Anthostomella pinea]|uniref:Uu.00g144170.m01.CDS01 n=1 Tax=Anthostomella pinea TaxID=933095 RepID=A0AAI8YJC1_9PEZI|nr:Uu.00g144170.m01.CDS01 [Anthostomella pinea]